MSRPVSRTALWTGLFIALAIGIALALWLEGSSFYTTHPWDRAAHPDDARLRSSGTWGHGIGVAGTALILLNLTFMARRRMRTLRRFGALRLWMNMHVVTGLLGPLIVVFHTAFEPRTTIAVTALVAIAVLALTGVIGRFIYAMIPRTVAGVEMGTDELDKRVDAGRARVERAAPPGDPLWATVAKLSASPLIVPRSTAGSLALLPYSIVSNAWLRLRLARVRSEGRPDWDEVRGALGDMVLLRRRAATLQLYRKLLAWWRGLHRVAALVMIVTMTIHVVVLLYLGYGTG